MSTKQASRIRYYVNLLIDASKSKKVYQASTKKWYSFKVNLVTLTLPSQQIHMDKEIHEKIFKSFIRAWKQKSPELLYIYKAEVQDNGNLHYHLTTNTYIHHRELRNMWNYYCEKLGYVSRSGIESPNSTDVHSVKNIKKLAGYMVAYLSKKDLYTDKLKRYHRRYDKRLKDIKGEVFKLPEGYLEGLKRKVEIKIWDCSKPLMIGKCSMEIETDDMMQEVRKLLEDHKSPILKDWCVILPDRKKWAVMLPEVARTYNEHIRKLREHVKNQPAEYYIE